MSISGKELQSRRDRRVCLKCGFARVYGKDTVCAPCGKRQPAAKEQR